MSDVREAIQPVEDTSKPVESGLYNALVNIGSAINELPKAIENAAKFVQDNGFPGVEIGTDEIEMEPVFAGSALEHPGKIKDQYGPNIATPMETTTYEDGTVRQKMPNGEIIENRADGTQVHMKPDNSVTTITKDGTVVNASPKHADIKDVQQVRVNKDGCVSYDYTDGTKEQVWADDMRSVKFPDGSGYFKASKEFFGHLDVTHANGDSETYNEQGELIGTWRTNDRGAKVQRGKDDQVNTVIQKDSDKRRDFIRSLQTGEVEEIHGHLGVWKPVQLEDGKTGWKNESTGAVWAGKMEVDKDGNLHYTPDNGGQAYVFTPDGRDVKVHK